MLVSLTRGVVHHVRGGGLQRPAAAGVVRHVRGEGLQRLGGPASGRRAGGVVTAAAGPDGTPGIAAGSAPSQPPQPSVCSCVSTPRAAPLCQAADAI